MFEVAERSHGEWSTLDDQWHTTRRDWNDVVAIRFEKEFWSQWEADFPMLLRELDGLEETLDRALRSLS